MSPAVILRLEGPWKRRTTYSMILPKPRYTAVGTLPSFAGLLDFDIRAQLSPHRETHSVSGPLSRAQVLTCNGQAHQPATSSGPDHQRPRVEKCPQCADTADEGSGEWAKRLAGRGEDFLWGFWKLMVRGPGLVGCIWLLVESIDAADAQV